MTFLTNNNKPLARLTFLTLKPIRTIILFITFLTLTACSSITTNQQSAVQEQPSIVKEDLWDRLRTNFSLDLEQDNTRIQAQLNWYVKHPDYLDRVITRASRYLYHINQEIETRNLPGELALLPIVESAYDPFAYSFGRASGIWQFIPSTGRFYGLKQDWWYDGRRDITASTDAALTYLEHLNKRFDGDWQLALAAYNTGEGRVASAIRKNKKLGKPTDFWSLSLPAETRAYVPKLIAISKVFNSPEAYDISLISIADEPRFVQVDTGGQIDLAQAADLAELSIDELYLLNPGNNRWATRPEGPHTLLLPIEKQLIFEQNISLLPPGSRVNWQRYTIKSGDTLSHIANRFNTTTNVIQQANNLHSNTIRKGSVLLIPLASGDSKDYALSADQRLAKIQNRTPSNLDKTEAQKVEYRVQNGDSLWLIGKRYHVSVTEIARWNGLAPGDKIKPNQKLVIWSSVYAKSTASYPSQVANDHEIIRKVGYRVREGESLAMIAGKFNISINEITRWNTIDKSSYLQPGQRLNLYIDVTETY